MLRSFSTNAFVNPNPVFNIPRTKRAPGIQSPGRSLSQPRTILTEARLCDTKPIKNTVPYRNSKKLLTQLSPFLIPEVAGLAKEGHSEALKRLILVGSQLLDEQNQLSKHPTGIPGVMSIHPTSLILYRIQNDSKPQVLYTVPELKIKEFTWPFRQVANITQDWASGKSPLSAEFGINLAMQSLAALNDLATQGPRAIICRTAHLLENSILGFNKLAFSAPEFERLKGSAFKHGYSNDVSEFIPEVYVLMQNIVQSMERLGSSNTPLKLGISYCDPKDPKKTAIKDVSALFPECDLNAFLPEIERLRDQLEDLYYKS